MQFGEPIEWVDAGDEGLIPRVVSASAPSPERTGGNKNHRSHNHRDKSPPHPGGSTPPQPRRGSHNIPGGAMTGVDANDNVVNNEPLLPEKELLALWKQLILCCIAMGILYMEKQQPDQAMLLFKKAEEWAAYDEFITSRMARKELKAHVRDAISYYFFKRKKSIAALGYSEQAMEMYEEVDNMDGIAVCLLHVAAVYSQIGDFKEAHKVRRREKRENICCCVVVELLLLALFNPWNLWYLYHGW